MRIKKVLCLAVILCISITSVTYVSAKPSNEKMTDKEWQVRRNYIDENIKKLAGRGPEEVEKFFEENNIVECDFVKDASDISTKSLPGAVSFYGIGGYYDRVAGKYFVTGYWEWAAIGYVDNNAGAVDGVSLALCQTNWNSATGYIFSSNPANIAVYDQNGTYYPYAGGISAISKSGIAYSFQDAWKGVWADQYCGYRGTVWFYLDQPPTQLPLYIKMDLTHTWSSATLTSLGISWPTGSAPTLNMQFSNTPSKQPYANQTTLYGWDTIG